ncbi:MAG: DNA phosphorothioation-dependent restriction protein DptH [Marinobacterium sp.]|nr:DNA phosphorothioation-dependent restriction protein DptH [Marinobacterium sp.]
MSVKLFETFLAEHFINWARQNITAGFRYQFRSPSFDNSVRLYHALQNVQVEGIETLTLMAGDTELTALQCGDIKLVPVLHNDDQAASASGYTENFISYLRDEVAGQQGEFSHTALFVIHNSLLDTLINSASDVSAESGVYNPLQIKQALAELISQGEGIGSRALSDELLEYQFDLIMEDRSSMFGFEPLYKAVADDGRIDFDEIGLLPDDQILRMDDDRKQIRKRLDQNRKLFEEISEVVEHYPDQLAGHLPLMGDKFIKEHFPKDDLEKWKTLELSVVLTEQESNRSQELHIESESSLAGKLISRVKSNRKADQKNRHLLLSVSPDREDFDLVLEFCGDKVRQAEVKLTQKGYQNEFSVSGGSVRSTITITGQIDSEPRFFLIALDRNKTSEKYKFNCLVVKEGWFNTEAFENSFLINPRKSLITLQSQETSLQLTGNREQSVEVLENSGDTLQANSFQAVDYTQLANEVDQIGFILQSGRASLTFEVEGAAPSDILQLPLLLDTGRIRYMMNAGLQGVYNRSKRRVYIENKESRLTDFQRALLEQEASLLEQRTLYKGAETDDVFTLSELTTIAPKLAAAYSGLFDYLEQQNSLPSLVCWDDRWCEHVNAVVTAYLDFLRQVPQKQYLDAASRRMVQLGFCYVPLQVGHRQEACAEFITPYHPLILAYYHQLVTEFCQSEESEKSFESLPPITLERLNPQGLLPFIFDAKHGFSYVNADSNNSFWLRCVPYEETSYSYIVRLVRDKISEFAAAFEPLFDLESTAKARPTLTINSVNNHDNYELFLGVVEHIQRHHEDSFNIHVNLYDESYRQTEFDRFSDLASYDQIKERYGLNKGKQREYADNVVDLLRTRLTYSKFTHKETHEQAYAHLTFFRNNQKVKVIDVNPQEKLSGVTCDGLISGEASSSEQNNYLTGFGLHNIAIDGLPAVEIALLLGRMLRPARESTAEYRDNSAIALAVDEAFRAQLNRSYDSSVWTTIIDPKVTLEFFHQERNMLLIHYSDQYTSSASYDAITVTRQTELYERVLNRDKGGLITEFNAFNGEWLLKMITDRQTLRKEKKGILAAYKDVSCLLAGSDITWVPVSVAEMIRVAGNIGLKIDDSEFSRNVQGYKSGAISDDVLFVGFKNQQLYLLPLEVKTGKNYDASKAIAQARELSRYLREDLLSDDTLAHRLYRSLFVRQALAQVDKYLLYRVYPDGYFDQLMAEKEQWLQGNYQLGELDDYPLGFVVANLEGGSCLETSAQVVDSILKIEIPASLMGHTIGRPLKEMLGRPADISLARLPEKYFLTPQSAAHTQVVSDIAAGSESQVVMQTTADVIVIDSRRQQSAQEVETDYAEAIEVTEERADVADTDGTYQQAGEDSADRVVAPPVSDGPLKVLVGHDVRDNREIFWEPTNTARFMNTNSGIIGTMGTGKTQCTKSVVTQLYRNRHNNVDGADIGILIFDYKSDYIDDTFLEATNGNKYNLHKLPYNPLSLFGNTPMLPVHTARAFSETMGRAFQLGTKQQLRLRKLIAEAYELAGIHKADSSTWSRPAPTITDIWNLFIEQEKVEEDSLYAALESLYELEVFEDDVTQCTSLYELVDGIRVVELAGYPSQIQNLVVALTLDLFYAQMQKQGKPAVQGDFRQVTKLILVDEADNFMSQDFPSLRKVLKEGREYGVGVILSTQDITHFKTKENDYSAYILSWIVHRVSQIKNQDIKSLFNKDDKAEQERLMNTIRELEKHHSLYVDGQKTITKIRDRAFWELFSKV